MSRLASVQSVKSPRGGEPPGWQFAHEIDGWLTFRQAVILSRFAAQVQPGEDIVEVGSHQGRSTVVLASSCTDGVEVMAVDPWIGTRWGGGTDSYEAFRENLARASVEDRVRIHRSTSQEAFAAATATRVGLVFIDGAHDYESALFDVLSWSSRLVPGGVMCVHDAFSSPGVTFAVIARFLFSRGFRYLGADGSLACFRVERLSTGDTVIGSLSLLSRLRYLVKNLLIKRSLLGGTGRLARALGHAGPTLPF